jgi:hypothetical protein
MKTAMVSTIIQVASAEVIGGWNFYGYLLL